MKAALEQIVSSCPGDHTVGLPDLEQAVRQRDIGAMAGERRQPTMPRRAHVRRVAGHTETPAYAGLLAWSQTLKGNIAAQHA
jgi:hypothetical protein